MRILFPRVDCRSPQQYYTCASNGFKGCCSVDPCPLTGCPDSKAANNDGASTASQDGQPTSKANGNAAKSNGAAGDQSAQSSTLATTVQALTTVQASSSGTAVVTVWTSRPATSRPSPPTTSQPAPPATSQPAPPVTSQPSPTQSQTTSQQPASSAPSSAASNQAPSTIVIVSTAVQTPTSNGIALAPTTLLVTTTALSSPDAAVQTSSSAPTAVAGSAPSSNGPVIGGVVGGVGGVLIAAALLWFCFWRTRKKMKESRERAAHSHEDDPREQGIDAHRAGDVIAGYRGLNRGVDRHLKVQARESVTGSDSTVTATDYGSNVEKKLPTPPVCPNRPGYPEEAVPYLDSTPVRPNIEMIGSSPDPTGFTPELSGVAAAHQPAELSSNPERLRINNRSSAYHENGNAGPRASGGSLMRSNLNLSNRGQNGRARSGAARHVLSWMEYSPNGTPRSDGRDSSPTSGVWSSAESSNFVRDSGVSQDSSTHGWQRERRMKDGGGGLEAITDEPRI